MREHRVTRDGIVIASLFAGLALAVAGCQSGSGGANRLDAGVTDAPPPPSTKVTASELVAYCPRVTLREGTAFYNTYGPVAKKKRSAEDEALGIEAPEDRSGSVIYQAAISDVTRACTYEGGMLTINVAVAGKVVPGPLGKPGTINMPIRVAVVRGEDVLHSNLTKYPVTIADTSGATQFVYNEPAITIPMPEQRNVQVFAGYDEGPPARKK